MGRCDAALRCKDATTIMKSVKLGWIHYKVSFSCMDIELHGVIFFFYLVKNKIIYKFPKIFGLGYYT